MRITLLAAAILLAGCHTYTSDVSGTAGEGIQAVDTLSTIYVVPVELPEMIHGEITPEEMQTYRREWPADAARLVAKGISEQAEGVSAMYRADVPNSGVYFALTVDYLDYGEAKPPLKLLNADHENKTNVRADGLLIDAATGEVVGSFSFVQGTAYGIEKPFEMDMYNVGRELGDWIDEHR